MSPGNDRAPRRDNRRATSGRAGSGTTSTVAQPSVNLAEVVRLPSPTLQAEFMETVAAVVVLAERLRELADDATFDDHRTELLERCRPGLARASMDLLRFVTAPAVAVQR